MCSLARQRAADASDPEVARINRFEQEAAAAVAAKLRAKRKLRSWYWHKVPLWRRALGLGGEFFPIEKEAMRMYERMLKPKRTEVGTRQLGRNLGDPTYGTYEYKTVMYRAQRRAQRLKKRALRWRSQKTRYFAYWFYWRLSRPIPLLWRLPLFAFVRVPILCTLYPLAFLAFGLWYPFVLAGRVLRPIPGLLNKVNPFPAMYRFVNKSIRAGFSLPDQSPEASDERRQRLTQDMQRFMSKGTMRSLWRRVSDALYQRAHPEFSAPEWDPDFLKRTIREELRGMRELRKDQTRIKKEERKESEAAADDEALFERAAAGSADKTPETAAQIRQTESMREQAKRRR